MVAVWKCLTQVIRLSDKILMYHEIDQGHTFMGCMGSSSQSPLLLCPVSFIK